MIIITPQLPYEEEEMDFKSIQQSIELETWRGRACTAELPGGGNNPTGKGGEEKGE